MVRHYIFPTITVLFALFIGLWSLLHPPIQEKIDAYLASGEKYLDSGTYNSAFRVFSKAAALSETNQQARRGLAISRINYFTYFELYTPDLVSSRIEEIAETAGNAPYIDLFMGDKALFSEDLALASSHYEVAVRSSPELAQALFAQGVVDLKLGNRRKARGNFEKAILKAPRILCYNLTFAEALVDEGRVEEALDIYNRTISEHPYDYPTHVGLATLSLALGLYDEALSHIEVLKRHLDGLRNSSIVKKNRKWTTNYLQNRTLETYEEKTVYVDLLRLLTRVLSGDEHLEKQVPPPTDTDLPDRVVAKLSDDVRTVLKLSPSKQPEVDRFSRLIGYPYIDWVHGSMRDGYVYCGGIYH